jgi:hypothetical protein
MRSPRYHKLVNPQRLDPQDMGWNACILSKHDEDMWDHNPFDSNEWPESEKWAEFANGWRGAEEDGPTEDNLITSHLKEENA